MEKITLISLFDAFKLKDHRDKIYKIIDQVDEEIREELIKCATPSSSLKLRIAST